MGRRKSVKADNVQDLRRQPSQYNSKVSPRSGGGGNGGSRGRHGSNDSDDANGGGKPTRMSRAPSTKNMSRTASKSGSSFHRPARPTESPSNGYKGFHVPSGEPQLEPLPTPRGAVPMNMYNNSAGSFPGNVNTSNNNNRSYPYSPQGLPPNGFVPNGNGSTVNTYSPRNGASPVQSVHAGKAASAPLTRRASQVRITSDQPPTGFSPYQAPVHHQQQQQQQQQQQPSNMRYPVQGGGLAMNGTAYQPPLPSPAQSQSYTQPSMQRPGVDFTLMMQWYRNLPQLPYVMSPQGPLAPPPYPFPYPDPVHVQQLQQQQQYQQQQQQQRQQGAMSPSAGPTSPAPPHQYYQQQQPYPAPSPTQAPYGGPQQQQHQQPMYHQPQPTMQQPQPMAPSMPMQHPPYGPQGANMTGNVAMNGGGAVGPLPAPVSPSSGSSPAASAAAPAPALPRTTSILNRVSSFKKPAPGTAVETTRDKPDTGAPPATSPSSGILNRVSSFKKSTGATTSSLATSAAPVPQTSPTAAPNGAAASAAPPQHSATLPKAAAESPAPSILRRKSFFMAAAVPEPELSSEEREAVLQEKLQQRELERQRLEAEHEAREAAAQKLHEERLKALREAQAAAAAPTTTTTSTEGTAKELAPAAATTAVSPQPSASAVPRTAENLPTTPDRPVSRASSYSFNSSATLRSGRSQPPLPQVQRQPQQQQPASTAREHIQRAASPTPEIGEDYYKSEPSVSSSSLAHRSTASVVPALPPPSSTTAATTSSATYSNRSGNAQRVATPPSGQTAAALTTKPQLWHRCPSLVLYEIPLRCRRTTNEKGEDVIDDANFPVRIHHKTLRVADAATEMVSEYPHDEFVTHRKGSTNVESKLLDKVKDVVLAGYAASVLSLDAKGLAKPTAAFESASWMAQQRLVLNVVRDVEKMHAIYAKQLSGATATSSIEAFISIALVKKVSAEKASEWNIPSGATRQRTFEVVDLLRPEPSVVPFRMHTSVLFGQRLGSVEYKAVAGEADFSAALASAQSNANSVLGRLADAAAVDPTNEDLAKELASVFEVLTCVVRHRKEGAVALTDQLREAPRDVYARGSAAEVLSSDDEDDDARLFAGFNSHNEPSNCSDMVVSCLTCIGVRENADLWAAALERREEAAPTALFSTAFGGPAHTVILASIDPTKQASAETLSVQAGMTIKLHRRPMNGSARRLIQSSKFQAGAAQKELERPERPSGAEQRELKTMIRKSAATLDTLEKALASGG